MAFHNAEAMNSGIPSGLRLTLKSKISRSGRQASSARDFKSPPCEKRSCHSNWNRRTEGLPAPEKERKRLASSEFHVAGSFAGDGKSSLLRERGNKERHERIMSCMRRE